MNSYAILFVLSLAVLIGVASYLYPRRKQVDEMHGMMVGMTLGMIAGLVTATLYLIPTGNFLWGVILGSIAGLVFGIPSGRLGGHLGVMEGVVAGPMGGMMGAMLGQMIRPFDIEVFIPFFTAIFLLTMIGITYSVHCGVSCCGGRKKPAPVGNAFIAPWTIAAIILLSASIVLSFPLGTSTPTATSSTVKLPGYLQSFTEEIKGDAVVNGNVQEITMKIAQSRYTPNVIVAKKGILLKLNVIAEEDAGCASEIVFPEFKIRTIVGPGTSKVLDILPEREGEFLFRCSMDMARGKLIVIP